MSVMRQTQDRITKSALMVRPRRPLPGAPEYSSIHHDVHLAIVWLNETTTVPLDAAHTQFAHAHYDGSLLAPAALSAIAKMAIGYLMNMSNEFSPANYTAIYNLLHRGVRA